jgi:hypothetical protein
MAVEIAASFTLPYRRLTVFAFCMCLHSAFCILNYCAAVVVVTGFRGFGSALRGSRSSRLAA